MNSLILVLYLLLSVGLIGLILLQQGRGASMGAAFGGGVTNALFGPAGTGNMLTRATAILAFLFIALNLFIAIGAKQELLDGASMDIPALVSEQQSAPAQQDLPDLTDEPAPADLPSLDDGEQQ